MVLSPFSNFEADEDAMLLTLPSAPSAQVRLAAPHVPPTFVEGLVKYKDEKMVLQRINALNYIGGFMARRIKSKVCSSCCAFLTGSLENKPEHFFLQQKKYEDAHLYVPC
jgi:hypothetical protein